MFERAISGAPTRMAGMMERSISVSFTNGSSGCVLTHKSSVLQGSNPVVVDTSNVSSVLYLSHGADVIAYHIVHCPSEDRTG